MAPTAELSTLEALYNTLKTNVSAAHQIQVSTDSSLDQAIWDTPNAKEFREAWLAFKPHLLKFEETLAAAATDVANNHNNNALVNGVTDAPTLAAVTPVA